MNFREHKKKIEANIPFFPMEKKQICAIISLTQGTNTGVGAGTQHSPRCLTLTILVINLLHLGEL